MAKQTIANLSDIEKKPLREFSEKAYLNYSMYVILDRALPHIGDGLKPVQRRIIYSMSELGLNSQAKHKKSARTVGDVLGKYHPHGDSACYEAMVLMAQDFSYRYPIINGQGNWGSPDDPKSFAAMRYTESKLSPYAEVLLKEIDQGTVDWGNNFDGTLREPTLLPARLPNVLLNGSTGIAVGMATDIPPHNLREVANACLHLLRHPKTSLQELCEYIQGPDFPSSAEIITPKEEIMAIYQSGNGTIRLRARYIEENDTIVIVALPYQASPAKVLEQIAAQMQAKKLPLIADLRDESDHENPTRLVIIPRSQRVDVEELMSHLFATTDLEKTIRINLNMIGLDGRPTVKSLLHILQEWLEFRVQTVRRRLQYRLDKVLARLHVLDGLLIAYLNIDEVIAIIRKEDEPKPKLMKRFKLSEQQAEAILELKLRHLARLEEVKIRSEQQDLSKEKDSLQQVLDSPKKLKDLIFNEIKGDAEKYGDARKSPLVARQESQALNVTEVLPVEPVTVVLSNKGWVRAAKGHDIDPRSLSYRAGDEFKMAVKGRSNQWAVFLDSTGRAYSLPAHSLPSARSHGEPLTSRVNPPEGASFAGVMIGEEDQLCLLAANNGYGFIAKLADLQSKSRNGKAALNLAKSATPLTPCFINDLKNDYIAAVSNTGHLLLFSVNSLPMLAKGKGNKIMHIPTQSFIKGEEYIVDVAVIGKTEALSLRSGQRSLTLKPQDLTNFLGERGQRGKKLPRGFQKVEKLIPQNDLGIIL